MGCVFGLIEPVVISDSGCSAQAVSTLVGRATDLATGLPLDGVVISLREVGLEAVTGEEGWYVLTGIPAGRHELVAEHLGYAVLRDSLEVASAGALTVNLELRPEAIPLDELVVTVESDAVQRLGHRTIVHREELERRKASTFSQLIQGLIPGVTQTTTSGQVGASTQIRIRGIRSLEEAYPLFFVDGVRVGSARTDGPPGTFQILDFLNSINPNDVDRVEVVRNPEATLLYGADARGGVILIFTKRGGLPGDPASEHPRIL
jgi:outer membrane receptor protein involved in Fe transport